MKPRLIGGGVTLAVLLLVGGLAWLGRNAPPGPSVGIRFVGLSTNRIHRNPFGYFEITNPSATEAAFALSVEAPDDPHLMMSRGFESDLGFRELGPGEGRRTEVLVASGPGIPFRPMMVYTDPPSPMVRVWLRVVRIESRLGRLWSPAPVRVRTEYGEWSMLGPDVPVER